MEKSSQSTVKSSILIKHLASCNNATRDKAIKLFLTWLPSQTLVSDEDMKKIWKGLFYCVWHSDKALIQAQLIDRLASLLVNLSIPLSVHYFSCFLFTIRREWSGIDHLRLDKFYLLIRRFMHSFFEVLKKFEWDFEVSSRFMSVLEENCLVADHDKVNGNGVSYHVCSVFLEEIRDFLPVGEKILDVLFKPLVSAMGKSGDKVLVGKIKCNVFEFLLKMGEDLLEARKLGGEVDGGVEVFGVISLKLGFSGKFYELGSSSECLQGNRKVVLGLHEAFLKLETDLAHSGVEFSLPEVKESNGVPCLIPITTKNDMDLGGEGDEVDLANERSKKSKKTKKGLNGSGEGYEVDLASEQSKKSKKAKKGLNGSGSGKKKVKKNPKKEETEISIVENEELVENDENLITFDETVISNLQMQFEKVAAEVGLDNKDDISSCLSPMIQVNATVIKKRKRVKNMDAKSNTKETGGGEETAKSGEKSAKKVKFSMKSNLVWKPHSPLPPQSLRIPPSVTPRGSALKKGVSPGPIREMTSSAKKVKKRTTSLKKGRKAAKPISPAVKRLRKLQSLSI